MNQPGGLIATLVCATANPDKVVEMRSLLAGVVDLLPRPEHIPEVVEDADTLIGNARLKARAIRHATGLAAVADDTGLFVDALGGRPGVRSARYAGEDATYAANRAKLLHELTGVDDPARRTARFVTSIVVAYSDGSELAVEGVCPGRISLAASGSRGFGYDAVFVPDGDSRTFAEMSDTDKNAISHRGRALQELVGALSRRSQPE